MLSKVLKDKLDAGFCLSTDIILQSIDVLYLYRLDREYFKLY